ncbi:MAG TPA: putative toxin-antitoxin system toxin component, PIN family [Pyrinomonadaceae bacterium]|nr:putative toxin-antitoxin system toxin component, PIN family [Pyrinomonadaceae bacterium]
MKNRPSLGVVFDCNILLQAVARKTGPAAACLRLAEEGFVHLRLSEEILTELSEVLKRAAIRSRYPELTDEIVEDFLKALRSTAEITSNVPKRFTYPRDPDDEPYLNLAIDTEANYLVSRDKDLLDLMTGYNDECKEFRQRFRSLTVLEPVEFLNEVRRYRADPG